MCTCLNRHTLFPSMHDRHCGKSSCASFCCSDLPKPHTNIANIWEVQCCLSFHGRTKLATCRISSRPFDFSSLGWTPLSTFRSDLSPRALELQSCYLVSPLESAQSTGKTPSLSTCEGTRHEQQCYIFQLPKDTHCFIACTYSAGRHSVEAM